MPPFNATHARAAQEVNDRLQEEMEVREEHAVQLAAAVRVMRGAAASDASPAGWRTATVDRMADFLAVP